MPTPVGVTLGALSRPERRNRPARTYPHAVFGGLAAVVVEPLLPCATGFAAGAVPFVISGEIGPDIHTQGRAAGDTRTVVTLYLDVSLG